MPKSVEEYMALGMDRRTAAYFAGGRRTIESVTAAGGYRLLLSFDNGEQRIYDCAPLFGRGSVFEKIHTPEAFARVYLDEHHAVSWDIDPAVDSSIVWSNKLDLCPDSCYMDSVPA